MDWKDKYPQYVTKSGGVKQRTPVEVKREIFILRATEIHNNRYDYSKVDYINTNTKVIITCPMHGDWQCLPAAHVTGGRTGCPRCSDRSKSQEDFLDQAKKIHKNIYDYSLVEYKGARSKIVIGCALHGNFTQQAQSHLLGHGCPTCAGNHLKTTEKFIEEATAVHGKLYDYSSVDYTGVRDKVKILCKEHGEFLQTPHNHLHGRGCPTCARNQLKTTEKFIEEATSVHGSLYDYSSVNYIGALNKVTIRCPEHGEFLQAPNDHLKGSGCPTCRNRSESNLVYIFSDPIGNYKIGIAHDINKRKKQQESSSGIALCVVAYKELPGEREARELERQIHTLNYENPYSGSAFDGYTEWRTIPKHDLEQILTTYGFIKPH